MGANPHSDSTNILGAREAPKAGGTEASSARHKHQNKNGTPSSYEDGMPNYYAENFIGPGNQQRRTCRPKQAGQSPKQIFSNRISYLCYFIRFFYDLYIKFSATFHECHGLH